MDTELLFDKTCRAGMFGLVTSTTSWIAGEFVHGLLGNVTMLIGLCAALISIIYMIRINRHRNQIKAIEEARETTRLCRECRLGVKPIRCPIPPEDRPPDCPMNLKG